MTTVEYSVRGKKQILGMPESDIKGWEARKKSAFGDEFKVIKIHNSSFSNGKKASVGDRVAHPAGWHGTVKDVGPKPGTLMVDWDNGKSGPWEQQLLSVINSSFQNGRMKAMNALGEKLAGVQVENASFRPGDVVAVKEFGHWSDEKNNPVVQGGPYAYVVKEQQHPNYVTVTYGGGLVHKASDVKKVSSTSGLRVHR